MEKAPEPDPPNGGKARKVVTKKGKGGSKKKNTVGAVLKNWQPVDDRLACNVCLDTQDYLNNSLMQCARYCTPRFDLASFSYSYYVNTVRRPIISWFKVLGVSLII